MILTTSNDVAGRTVKQYLGIVRGVVVRSPSIAQGMLGGLKQMIGGNIEAYAKMCDQARQHAFDRMLEHANQLGADAVIAVRYDATDIGENITEVLAYGTAVKLG
jgi:uncharacterized protein YbjQ (UPF0145 family)